MQNAIKQIVINSINIMKNNETVTIEEIEQLLLTACKTDLNIAFIEKHSSQMTYRAQTISISSHDDLGKMKREIMDKLKNKGVNPNKNIIDRLAKLVSKNTKNYTNTID